MLSGIELDGANRKLNFMNDLQVLRERLDLITEAPDTEHHPERIEALRTEHPHSVHPMTMRHSNLEFNCVMYALGVESDQFLINLISRCPYDVHLNTTFARLLIDAGYLEECSVADGATLVAYFKGNKIEHIGRLTAGNRVASKWGIGHLYEHDLMEVPSSYGDTIRFFTPRGDMPVTDLFRAFAEANGVEF